MINKRNFLKRSATAIAATAGTTASLAAVRPRLGPRAGAASWRAHVGQRFEVNGHAVTLQAVHGRAGHPPGEQFSLQFAGELPSGLTDGLHTLGFVGGEPMPLYLARTETGLRADFCHLQA